jgi:hypothetical protein
MRAQLIVVSLVALSCSTAPPLRPHDLDGDGRDELLVWQSWDGRLRTLELDGTLGETVIQLARGEQAFRIGDMNGDGRGELVVHDGLTIITRVRVFLGRADGTVEPVPFYDRSDPLLGRPAPAGDVNGDGLADLAIATIYSTSYIVFGDPSGPRVSEFTMPGGLRPVMDLDGDGRSDLISIESESDGVYRVHVRLGGSDTERLVTSDHSFSWAFPDPTNPARDLLIDVTYRDDGTSSYTGVSAWNGNGFSSVDVEIPPGRPGPRGQILGDALPESLFLSRVTGTECATYIGQPGSILARIDGVCDSDGWFGISVAGDLDGDGFDDLAYPERSDDTPYVQHLRVRGGGQSTLTEGMTIRPTFEEVYQPFTRAAMWPAGDLNGDGITDLLGVGVGCAHVALGGPRLLVESFCEVSDDLPRSTTTGPFVLGPLDEYPGDEVVFVGLLLTLHDGWLEGRPVPEHLHYWAQRIGDVDADGLEDWAYDQVLYGGSPDLLTETRPVLLNDRGFVMGLGDVNGDGIDDVGVGSAVRFGGPDVVTRGDDLDLSTLGEYVNLARTGDRDGDGRADIGAWWYRDDGSTGSAVLGLRDGGLVVREAFSWHGVMYAGDLDGDGRSELFGQRGIHFATGEMVEVAGNPAPVDLDGDGRDEVVLHVPGSSSTSLVRWNGTEMVEMEIERRIPFSEFAFAPVH